MYGFITLQACAPEIKVGDPLYNAEKIIAAIQNADRDKVSVVVFPELCLTGYTCGDLFHQSRLLDATVAALGTILSQTANTGILAFIGAPLLYGGKLYNCAVAISGGRTLGVVPKTYIPNYGEFYEARHFASGLGVAGEIAIAGCAVPFGTDVLFQAVGRPELTVAAEICEDLWVPCPPSQVAARRGATVLVNLSASDETIGKSAWRRTLVASQSGRCLAAYVYADASPTESTGDLVFAAHQLIAENGTVVAESAPFENGSVCAVIDLEKLVAERRRINTFVPESGGRIVYFSAPDRSKDPAVSRTPFVPQDDRERAARAQAILDMQSYGLKKRLEHIGCNAVLGISGGLDSTLALLVTARAYDLLGKPRKDITAVTMPGFGTSARTKKNADELIKAIGATRREIDITAACKAHFADIGHDENDRNVVYENAQARERTQILMDIANEVGGIVVGTGDLSELALGWATYNGDQMSMYGVNASVPKTLVKYLVAAEGERVPKLKAVLTDVLNTEISPELLPPENGKMQSTEDKIGKYEINDFFLYYVLRYGFTPKKILYLAALAFPEASPAALKDALKNFYRRFFTQQFKRSALPDGVKIGSVSLSPRGDWRMPSDASFAAWLEELEK